MFNKFECDVDGKTRMRVHCNTCGHDAIHFVEAYLNGSWGDLEYAGAEEHKILRCGGCDNVQYSAAKWDEHDIDYDEDGESYAVKNVKYYPAPITRKTDDDFWINVPYRTYSFLQELLRSQSQNDLILSTMGLRLLLEMICNDTKCKSKTLFQKINELNQLNLITEEEKALFHQVRNFGNAGAHQGEAMSAGQIVSGIDICLDLLDKIFVQPSKKKSMIAKAKSQLETSSTTENKH